MDIAAIREAFTLSLTGIDFSVYPAPFDGMDPPAAVIGLPTQIRYGVTLRTDQIIVPIILYVAVADADDAIARMDAALSTGTPGSVIDVLRATRSAAFRGEPSVPLVDSFRHEGIGQMQVLACEANVTVHA